jgi:hypothetical protein
LSLPCPSFLPSFLYRSFGTQNNKARGGGPGVDRHGTSSAPGRILEGESQYPPTLPTSLSSFFLL